MDHVANLTKLRRALVHQRVGDKSLEFDMCEWVSTIGCGTAACIGGTAELLMQIKVDRSSGYPSTQVQEWMGGNFDKDDLFFGSGDHKILPQITLADAVAAVDHLIAGNRFTNWTEFGYGRTEVAHPNPQATKPIKNRTDQ